MCYFWTNHPAYLTQSRAIKMALFLWHPDSLPPSALTHQSFHTFQWLSWKLFPGWRNPESVGPLSSMPSIRGRDHRSFPPSRLAKLSRLQLPAKQSLQLLKTWESGAGCARQEHQLCLQWLAVWWMLKGHLFKGAFPIHHIPHPPHTPSWNSPFHFSGLPLNSYTSLQVIVTGGLVS